MTVVADELVKLIVLVRHAALVVILSNLIKLIPPSVDKRIVVESVPLVLMWLKLKLFVTGPVLQFTYTSRLPIVPEDALYEWNLAEYAPSDDTGEYAPEVDVHAAVVP